MQGYREQKQRTATEKRGPFAHLRLYADNLATLNARGEAGLRMRV